MTFKYRKLLAFIADQDNQMFANLFNMFSDWGARNNLEASPRAYAGIRLLYHLGHLQHLNMDLKFKSTTINQKTGGSAMTADWSNRNPSIVNPFIRLPDVKDFKVNLGPFDPLLSVLGWHKRMSPTLIYERYGNGNINRYINHQVIRLNQSIDSQNYPLFWAISRQILKHSNSFLVISLHHCEHNWHRKLPLSVVQESIKIYRDKRQNSWPEIDYKRVYIPKSNNQLRPLGVPTLGDRMYLHTWQCLISILLKNTIPKTQHGFYPGRGTLTAWKSILRKLRSKSIYSFDLKGCFDNINVYNTLRHFKQEFGPPLDLFQELFSLSHSLPKFDQILLEEPNAYRGLGRALNKHKWFMKLKFLPSFYRAHSTILTGTPIDAQLGFPQGNPFSPILTSYALSLSLQKVFPNNILYADDGLLINYTREEIERGFNSPLLKHYGVHRNIDKSFWVKEDNQWLDNLKFLGLTYLFKHDELMSSIRNQLAESITTNSRSWYAIRVKSAELLQRLAGYTSLYTVKLRPLEQELFNNALSQDEELTTLIEDSKLTAPEYLHYHKGDLSKAVINEWKWDSQYGWVLVPVGQGTSTRKWEEFIKSKLSGFIQSRLYHNKWDLTTVAQDFTYKFSHNSWSGCYNHKFGDIQLNIFNSSSYACRSLLNMLRHQYRYAINKSTRQ